ncbi:MAG: DUF3144 domain-containing protein [Proteobacteria bacterium]|nr:DUF3144 domain-containing protein [Pseudomonadota bacterium]
MSDQDDPTLAMQIANQFIGVANARLDDGVDPHELATAMRHAAANFSAFAAAQDSIDPKLLAGEFADLLDYYVDRHRPAKDAAGGLFQLIEQAKKEI